jgi:hypothetical protein
VVEGNISSELVAWLVCDKCTGSFVYIGLGGWTPVSQDIVRLAPYQRSYWLIDSGLTSVIPKGYADKKKHKQTNKITKNKTLDKRNPPPFTVSCAPSGDEGPTVYIQTKENRKEKQNKNKNKTKNQNKLFHVQIKKNPGGLSNIPPYT